MTHHFSGLRKLDENRFLSCIDVLVLCQFLVNFDWVKSNVSSRLDTYLTSSARSPLTNYSKIESDRPHSTVNSKIPTISSDRCDKCSKRSRVGDNQAT